MTNISGQLKYLLYLSIIHVCEKCSVLLLGNDKMQSTKYNMRENLNKLGPFWFYIHLFMNQSSVNGMDHNFCGGQIGKTKNTKVCSQMSLSQTVQKIHKQKHSIITILRCKAQVFTKMVGTGISSGQCLMQSKLTHEVCQEHSSRWQTASRRQWVSFYLQVHAVCPHPPLLLTLHPSWNHSVSGVPSGTVADLG